MEQDAVKDAPKDHIGYYRIEEDLYQRLEREARRESRPVSYLVRLAILELLKRRRAS